MKIIFRSINFIRQILPKEEKGKAIKISVLLFFNSFLELLGLGAILPLFLVLLEDNLLEKYKWLLWIYNAFGLTNEKQLIVVLAVAFLLVIIIKNLISLWITKKQNVFCYSLFTKFTIDLHKLYYKYGYPFFKSTNSNVVVRDVRLSSERFAQAIVLGTLTFMNELIILIFIVTGIAIYNIQILGILLVTVTPVFLFFYSWVRKRSIELGNIKNRIEPIIGKNIFQSIFGYVDVVVSGAQTNFRDKIEDNVKELSKVNVKTNIYNLAPTRVIETSLMLAITVIVAFGIYWLPSKVELIKILGLFVIAGYRIMPSINRMMIAINGINQNIWVFDILEPLIKNEDTQVIQKQFSFNNYLELNAVDFAYPNTNENVLTNFSLKIKKGEVIGFVGPSGSGKTTVMNILLGFLKPTKGVYKIDNTVINESYHDDFYKKVGYVQQQVYLLDGTIAENIAFGCEAEKIDKKKLKKVIKQASLLEMIEELEDGVDTMIGENGAKLSGGQRQRVGIARALYFDAEILFLDEATSALDDKTETEITESINKLSDGSLTIIIIAHRLSTLEGCSRILEINQKQ
ncbi:ABC transporter ATP-binding protein [Winogradskyella sp. PAMC22761]|nr:ABC transporter ATP-binding protein [Winogradskyella sp. PAMC22761]